MTLIDSSARRSAFLERAVDRLGLRDRVLVVNARVEACGREVTLRGTFDGVTARSFGRPAVVAECAAPLLKAGGMAPGVGAAAVRGRPGRRTLAGAPLHQLGLIPKTKSTRSSGTRYCARWSSVGSGSPGGSGSRPRSRCSEGGRAPPPSSDGVAPGETEARCPVPRGTPTGSGRPETRSRPGFTWNSPSTLDLGRSARQDRRRAFRTRRTCLMRIRRRDREPVAPTPVASEIHPYETNPSTAARRP